MSSDLQPLAYAFGLMCGAFSPCFLFGRVGQAFGLGWYVSRLWRWSPTARAATNASCAGQRIGPLEVLGLGSAEWAFVWRSPASRLWWFSVSGFQPLFSKTKGRAACLIFDSRHHDAITAWAATAKPLKGIYYRSVEYRYMDPKEVLSGKGAALYGGRFASLGTRAVYLAESDGDASREVLARKRRGTSEVV